MLKLCRFLNVMLAVLFQLWQCENTFCKNQNAKKGLKNYASTFEKIYLVPDSPFPSNCRQSKTTKKNSQRLNGRLLKFRRDILNNVIFHTFIYNTFNRTILKLLQKYYPKYTCINYIFSRSFVI